jgi:hypothetical protein
MKTKLLSILIWIMLTCYAINSNAQANTQLSNLVSPTKINQNLLPNTDNIRDLGSGTKTWRNLYLWGSVHLGGATFLAGGSNTAVGYYVLSSNTTGFNNTAAGYEALYSNEIGRYNTAIGYGTLYSNETGDYNTANGSSSLRHNTTGHENTAIGYQALYNSNAFSNLVAVGDHSLYYLSSGIGRCTAVGSEAGYSNTTGGDNTYLGYHAGNTVTTGSSNTMIGYGTDAYSGGLTNTTALGNFAITTASNQVRIGNSSVTSIGGYEPWTNLSDVRFKKNVKENVPGLAFINQLHAVTYIMDVTKLRSFLGEDMQGQTTTEGKTVLEKNPEAEAMIQKGIQEKEKIIRTGFVAQEVEEAAKRIGYDFSGVDKPANEHTPYGLRYSEFVVPLAKAVQELSQQNDDLKKQNEEFKSRLDKIEAALALQTQNVELGKNAKLEQNVPNPYSTTTTISYSLPSNTHNAYINFYASNGAFLKSVKLAGTGKGTINVTANELPSGAYRYSLIIDGKVVASKQMAQAK